VASGLTAAEWIEKRRLCNIKFIMLIQENTDHSDVRHFTSMSHGSIDIAQKNRV